MTEYMLMFSLGPVQPFISQARKTRDLWLGSYLFSWLMYAAMQGIEKTATKFVFPSNRCITSDISNLPNKYIAIFKTLEGAQAVAEKSKTQLEKCWEMLQQEVWDAVLQRFGTSETKKIWSRQTDPTRCFEVNWVIVQRLPEEKYGSWLGRTLEALDARKQLRDFTPQDEPGEKSTISGEREALRGDGIDRSQIREFWRQLATGHLSSNDISQDGSERLDAIDTIKRFAIRSSTLKEYLKTRDFPSTSSIATASFVERLLQEQDKLPALQDWLNATGGKLAIMSPKTIPYLRNLADEHRLSLEILRRDGDLYFSTAFTSDRLRKDYWVIDPTEAEVMVEQGIHALSLLLKAADNLRISRPRPYYAIIQMDGDRMGRLLGKVESPEDHTELSKALSDFSRNVQERYPGRLVYAGGDDVLAFAPLARDVGTDEREPVTNILDLADQLQTHYCGEVRASLRDEEQKKNVSASVGIAIANHLTPLSFVRQAVNQAEKLAKNRYGRNALVITVIRASGAQTRVGCRWHYDNLDEDAQPIPLFSRFYQLFKQELLSPKCVHILLAEASTLVWLEDREAQASEIKRVLKRHLGQLNNEQASSTEQQLTDKQREVLEKEMEQLGKRLSELARAMDITHPHPETTELYEDKLRYGLIEILGWLLVMAFLAQERHDL